MAFVNVLVQTDPTTTMVGQWIYSAKHVLFWNDTIAGRPYLIGDDTQQGLTTTITDLSIRDSVFQQLWYAAQPGAVIDNNHFIAGTLFGTNGTTGDPQWVDPTNGDYRPKLTSPLLHRVVKPLVPYDDADNSTLLYGAIGSFQP
jgi:hypothetical protein